ncbi:MAG: hypothetical protein ABL993_02395, partial [Vicinamibacterales bacterium]
MARIRTVKPEFWEDEVVGMLSMGARLLFIATWNLADDHGLLRWTPEYLKASVFMYDHDVTSKVVAGFMAELEAQGLVASYVGGKSSQRLACITKFLRHQRINRPQPSRLPPPPVSISVCGSVNDAQSDSVNDSVSDSPPEGKGREGNGREQEGKLHTHTAREAVVENLEVGQDSLAGRERGDAPNVGTAPEAPAPPPMPADVMARAPDELAGWLGDHAQALPDWPPLREPDTRRTLWNLYGPPSMRPNVWKRDDGTSAPPEDRPRLFAGVLAGYAIEGKRTITANEFAGALGAAVRAEYRTPRP